jgi:hypothetical protein
MNATRIKTLQQLLNGVLSLLVAGSMVRKESKDTSGRREWLWKMFKEFNIL